MGAAESERLPRSRHANALGLRPSNESDLFECLLECVEEINDSGVAKSDTEILARFTHRKIPIPKKNDIEAYSDHIEL